jgi:hypothetical protein
MDEKQKKLLAIGGGVGCVAICCFVALLVFVLIDPFGWIDRLFGGGDPLAESMPANTDMYLNLDIGRLLSDEAEAVVGTIIDSIPDAAIEDIETTMDEIVDEIFHSYGFTFSEDIQPWIGQYLSFAAMDLDSLAYGDPSENMIVALEVRNRGAADDFIQEYIEISEQLDDTSYESFEYRGVTIYEDRYGYASEALARSGKVLLFSPSAISIQDAIDAQEGDSLADNPEFKRITSEMPSNRFLTIYIGESLLSSFDDVMGGLVGVGGLTDTYTRSMALTFAFTDFGIQFDTFMGVDEAELDDAERDLMESMQAQGDLISMLPEDTVGFFISQGMDVFWESIENSMDNAYGGDFDDSMRFFEDSFGFRPDLDLFPLLDGEWSIAVVPGTDSMFLGETVGMGIFIIAESSQEDDLRDVVEDARIALERQGMEVTERSADDGTIYTIEDHGIEMLSMGIQDDFLMVGTDATIMQDMMEGSSSIESDRTFRDVWDAFPRNTAPVVYLNIHSLLDLYRQGMDASWDDMIWDIGFDPRIFTHMAAGSGGIQDGVIRATIIVFMEMD